MKPKSELILYQTEDNRTRIEVRLENETVWLTQAQMAELFQTTKQNISLHVQNILKEKELPQDSVVKEFLTTAADGKNYQVQFYNLDVIIAVGYRVKSHRGTQFRQWATQRLREYIVKGFTLDDERLKEGGTRNEYFDELLQRIREIRLSERNFYRKICDIYRTSVDYDPAVEMKLTQRRQGAKTRRTIGSDCFRIWSLNSALVFRTQSQFQPCASASLRLCVKTRLHRCG